MKLFVSTKNLIHKSKNEKNVPSFEVVKTNSVSVHCNLVDNNYQQKSKVVLWYLLKVDPGNLMFLNTYNTEFVKMNKILKKMVNYYKEKTKLV